MFARHIALIIAMFCMVANALSGDAEEHRRIGQSAFQNALARNAEFRVLLQTHNITEIICLIDGKGADRLITAVVRLP